MNLRPYQEDCLAGINNAWVDHNATLAVLPTGTGKTVIFAHLLDRLPDGKRALVVAHKDELLSQAWQKIRDITGEEPEIEKAELWADSPTLVRWKRAKVLVTSVQTQNAMRGANRRMERFDPDEFAVVVIDEAHHAVADTYRRLIDYYTAGDAKVVGFTATPDRADERALGQVFTSVAYEYDLPDAVHDGWLCKPMQKFVTCVDLDLSSVSTVAGDLNQGQLASVVEAERVVHEMVTPTIEIAGNRQVIMFCASRKQAEKACEIMNRHKPGAAMYIDCETPTEERRHLVKEFKAGKYQYFCNCAIATEGFDCPAPVIAIGRPTKSRSLYCQMVGRGTRPLDAIVPALNAAPDAAARLALIAASDKPTMLVIDFVGNSGRHKLVHTGDLLGGSYDDDVVEKAKRAAAAKGGEVDMEQELAEAAVDAGEEARRRRRSVKLKAAWKARDIDPFDVFDVAPRRIAGWHMGRPPTDRMIEVLLKAGIDNVEQLEFGHAQQLIREMIARREKGLCTYKQARILGQHGYSADTPFSEASRLLDQILGARKARAR